NHYPQDIERTAAASHDGLRSVSGVAFSIEEGGQERLVVVHELARHAIRADVEEVAASVRGAVATEHGLEVHAVAFIGPGRIPKTSSGKLQRLACKTAFLSGELEVIGVSAPREATPEPSAAPGGPLRETLAAAGPEQSPALIEAFLLEQVARVLDVSPAALDRKRPLVSWGVDSLQAVELSDAVRAHLGVTLDPTRLLDEAGIERLAAELADEAAAAGAVPVLPAGLHVFRPGEAGERPLSFAQERLWFLDALHPGEPTYNVPAALHLWGKLDVAVLRRVLDEIVRRHATLRTVFREVGGAPVQVVAPAARVALATVDLGGLREERREAETLRRMRAEAERPFDLAAGPLFRATLLRAGRGEHRLLLNMHHIVSDGWSAGVFLRELSALYEAFAAGRPSPLPEPAAQYADVADAQRARLGGALLDRQLAYWRARLAALPVLELPVDHPRPAAPTSRGAAYRFELPAELGSGLRALGRREGATAFMTLLGAWQALLARYAAQDDVVVGATVANRNDASTRELIGFFVNTLVMRTDLSGDPTVGELLGRVREATLGAFAHQDLPFERLVQELQPERAAARQALFQVALNYQTTSLEPFELPGLSVEPQLLDTGRAKFDLTLHLGEYRDGRVWGVLEYATDLFEAATLARMAGHFRNLAAAMAAGAEQRLSELELLGDAERAQVLVRWNDTTRDYPPDGCLHGLFEEQVRRTPGAIALVHHGEVLSYAELDRRANRLANHLRGLGVGAEVRVGVCLERTPDLLVSLLAILKAGGAYVPLDPAYPAERLAYMVEDAGARVVVTQDQFADRLPSEGVRLVRVDADRERIAAQSADAPESGVTAENLSHVIFTSGSTGRPKGVMIRHRSAAVLMHWLRENVSDEERSSVLFSTSINFDVSVAEIFGTLCWGGTLVLVENALELPAVADRNIVYASMVPTAAAELLRSGGIPASVRTLNLGGEALPNDLAQALYSLGTVEKVGNLYGPTEDTTYSTYSVVEKGGAQVFV
ncbi:MAG: AMP-binding protein, partial [Gemmatimonadetes bacterium]|nr:AMP-binding protein [Gemmatimonadota bacterium]